MKIFEIKEAIVEEVSFVDKGANKRKFHIIKSEGGNGNMEELKKLYKEVFGAEPDAQVSDLLKSADPEYITIITDALKVIQKHKADMPEEVVKAVETLASNFVVVKEAKEEEIKPAAEVKKVDEKPAVIPEVKIEKEEKVVETPVMKNAAGEELVEVDLDEFEKEVEKGARARLVSLGYKIPDKI